MILLSNQFPGSEIVIWLLCLGFSVLFSALYFYPAAAAAILADDDLAVDSLFELRDMGYDSYQAIAIGESGECLHGKIQRVLAERTKSFVHEQGIQTDASGGCLDFIGESEGEGERSKKSLAAG